MQRITLNIHDPKVTAVERFARDGRLSIELGGSISMFVTDAGWDAIVAEVARRRDNAKVIPESFAPAVKNALCNDRDCEHYDNGAMEPCGRHA